MATSQEITATEKLLELIRGAASPSPPEAGGAGKGPAADQSPSPPVMTTEAPAPLPTSAVNFHAAPEPGGAVASFTPPESLPSEPVAPESAPPEIVLSLEDLSFERELAGSREVDLASPPLADSPLSPPVLVLPEGGLSLEAGDEAPASPAVVPETQASGALPPEMDASPGSPAPEPPVVPLAPEAVTPAPEPALAPGPQTSNHLPAEDDDEEDEPLARPPVASTAIPSLESGIVILPPKPSLLKTALLSLRQGVSLLKSQELVNIAIDIQPGMIHLVKTKIGKQGNELLAYRSVPYDYDRDRGPEHLFEHQSFREVLFRALSEFVSGAGRQEIWCSYSFCRPVALANITIPRLPEAEIANAVFWSAKRELEFDETASLFDFSVLQTLDEAPASPKLQTLVTLVPRHEVQGVETMFKEAGFKLTGLTFPAAAIQNFLNQDDTVSPAEPVVYFTVRRASSFIDLFYQGRMFFSREIKTGADSFVEALLDQAGAQDMVIGEEAARGYLFPACADPEAASDELLGQLNLDGLKVIERLTRQLVRTFEYCGTTFKTPAVSRIVTSGEFTLAPAILEAIEARIGIRCSVIDPLSSSVFARAGQFSPGGEANLQVAVGLSLSDRARTANFLFTYADRQREAATRRVNNVIAIVTICLTVLCGLVFALEFKKELGQKARIAAMQAELDKRYQAEPRSQSGDYVSQSIQKVMQFHKDNRARLSRFAAIAIVGELVRAVDKDINLTDLHLDFKSPRPAKKAPVAQAAGQPAKKAASGTLTVAGYVAAPENNQEFVLMNLLKALTNLSLLKDPTLKTKEKAVCNQQEVLRFEIQLDTSPELAEAVAP